MKCSPLIHTPEIKCATLGNPPVRTILFNHKTKEVFGSDGLIGYGEVDNGILKITYSKEEQTLNIKL